MPTNRKRKSRNFSTPVLLDFVRILLMDGPQARHDAMMDRLPGSGKAEAFMMCKPACVPYEDNKELFKRYPLTAQAWHIHRAEILRIWQSEKRKGKPWGAQFDKE